MKIFLTGATGFIGSFLAESLLNKNYQVCCLVRKQSKLHWISSLGVDYYYGSLDHPASLETVLDDCDYIYHVAGVTKAFSEKDFMQGNYETTKNLVNTCLKSGKRIKRFIYFSSRAAVGPSPTLSPVDEKFAGNPVSYYGKSKLAAEQYLSKLRNRIPITIVRPPVVYGPRDKDLYQFFHIITKRIIPKISGQERYLSMIHVADLVRGTIICAEHDRTAGETYFIANDNAYSWDELISTTLNVINKKGVKITLPAGLMKIAAMINEFAISTIKKSPPAFNRQKVIEMQQSYWTCSADKARRDFGFKSEISLEEGIQKTLEWYRDKKWLNW